MAYQKSNRDSTQVLPISFNEDTGRVKVELPQQGDPNYSPTEVIITDGTDTVDIRPDGSIAVTLTDGGVPKTVFNEINAVATGVDTLVLSYTALADSKIRQIDVSGQNIAEYTIKVNSITVGKKRTYYTNINTEFVFQVGFNLVIGDVVEVRVLHQRPDAVSFNSTIQLIED